VEVLLTPVALPPGIEPPVPLSGPQSQPERFGEERILHQTGIEPKFPGCSVGSLAAMLTAALRMCVGTKAVYSESCDRMKQGAVCAECVYGVSSVFSR
jgi:hypothetical protein